MPTAKTTEKNISASAKASVAAAKSGAAVEKASASKPTSKPQTFSGVVVSDKMKDTCVVMIARYVKHQKYHKFMNLRTRLQAHDPGNTKKIGDKATIQACRPISKNKAFKVIS